MSAYKCLQCLAEGKMAASEGNGSGPAPAPVANDAITLAPSWQMHQIGPQQVIACVAVPTCGDHLLVERKSALDLSQGVVLGKIER